MARRPGRLSTFTVKKIGNWDGVIKFLSDSGYEVKKKTQQAQWDFIKKYKATVINHLLAQDLNWTELSERTKRSKNGDLILIDTETYLNNIKMWKQGNSVLVGVKKGISYKRRNTVVSLDRVAILNELGTSRVPARPLWEPSFQEIGGREGLRQFVVEAIYRRLKWLSRGKPITVTKSQIKKQIR